MLYTHLASASVAAAALPLPLEYIVTFENRSQIHSKQQPKRQIELNDDLAAAADANARCSHSLKQLISTLWVISAKIIYISQKT